MQLSAPTLPFDPTAALPPEPGDFRASGDKADPGPSRRSDFGAMLSAQTVGARSKATQNYNRGPALSTSPEISTEPEGDEIPLLRSDSPLVPSTSPLEDVAAAQNAIAVLLTSPGTELPTNPAPEAEPEIGLSLSPSVAGATTDTPTGTGDQSGRTIGSAVASVVARGRPFIAPRPSSGMSSERQHAGIHAYGLNAEGSPSRKIGAVSQAPTASAVLSSPGTGTTTAPLNAELPIEEPEMTLTAFTSVDEVPVGFQQEDDSASQSLIPSQFPVAGVSAGVAQLRSTGVESFAGTEMNAAALPDPAVVTEVNALEAPVAPISADGMAAVVAPESDSPVLVTQAAPGDAASRIAESSTETIAENIAAHLSRFADRAGDTFKSVQKTALQSDSKQVTNSYGRVGINAAKPESLMPAIASAPTPPPVATGDSSFDPVPLSFEGLVKGSSEGLSEHVDAAARRAVESALAVAEQLTPGEQRSVRLQFNVGGEELAVRVELRGDKVHTTFRTDSPELCTALAREWQSVTAASSGDRAQRLADPIFSSSGSGSGSGHGLSSDSGAAHQRDHGARYEQAAAQEIAGLRRALGKQSAVTVAPASGPTVPQPSVSSRRLQTFA